MITAFGTLFYGPTVSCANSRLAATSRLALKLVQATDSMTNPFFEKPILNSPYDYRMRHWELDEAGKPTQQITAGGSQ